MALQAIGNKIIILKEDEGDVVKESGIIVPDVVKQVDAEKAKVISVGTGSPTESANRQEPVVKEGQTVYVNRFAGQKIKFDGVEYVALTEEDILAIEV